jgi:hypothetical protein
VSHYQSPPGSRTSGIDFVALPAIRIGMANCSHSADQSANRLIGLMFIRGADAPPLGVSASSQTRRLLRANSAPIRHIYSGASKQSICSNGPQRG